MIDKFKNPTWIQKFRDAYRGVILGMKGGPTNSFPVHIAVAIAVILSGWGLGVTRVEMAILVGCIGLVFIAELFNSSLETLARSITNEQDEHIRSALDIASGAVLIASLTAAVVGFVVLGPALFERLSG